MPSNTLFDTYVLSEQLQSQVTEAISNAHRVIDSQIAANTDEVVVEHLIIKHTFVPISVSWDQKNITYHDEVRDQNLRDYRMIHTVQEHFMILNIEAPCSGSHKPWLCIPDNFPMKTIEGYVNYPNDSSLNGSLIFTISVQTNNNPEEVTSVIKASIESKQNLIDIFVNNINSQLEKSTDNLRQRLTKIVCEQRERLSCHQEVIARLDIPLKRNDNAPGFQTLALVREVVPPLKTQPKSTEYGISEDNYQYILKIIRHEGATHERLAKTFSKFEEEELRDLYLAHLNGHYQGSATGETFRGSGKTDILIEFDNRAAFIAELKIWKGESELLKAVDQLTKYTTWRDCKCSMVLYNKSVKGFSNILNKMIDMLRKHARFVRLIQQQNGNEWYVLFKSIEDENRLIFVHMFLLNLYYN